MDYEELVAELKKQPKTYLPGLMVELLKLCLKNKVFKDNDPMPFVKSVMLRNYDKKKIKLKWGNKEGTL